MTVIPEEPFRNRGDVRAEIRRCDLMGLVFSMLSFVCVLVGVVGEVLVVHLGLASMSWFLIALVFSVSALPPVLHSVAAKHLFGIESQSK